jgi:hypothetical protein
LTCELAFHFKNEKLVFPNYNQIFIEFFFDQTKISSTNSIVFSSKMKLIKFMMSFSIIYSKIIHLDHSNAIDIVFQSVQPLNKAGGHSSSTIRNSTNGRPHSYNKNYSKNGNIFHRKLLKING